MPAPLPLRLVLDTNVWLDWLVFQDADIAAIKVSVESGAAEIFIDANCEQELARVLGYPRRNRTLDSAAQAACLAICKRVARNSKQSGEREGASAPAEIQLPKCRDRADQKFLELARACGADFLITKDNALLELTRRKIRVTSFRIVTPRQFAGLVQFTGIC